MSNYTKILAFGLAGLLLAGCQSGIPKSAHLRTSAEMRDSVGAKGFTSWGHNPAGNDFVSYTAPDGTTIVRSGTFSDKGLWHVEPGGKWCLKWHKIRNGAETCLTQYVEGSDIYNVLPDGSIASVVTRQAPGNPDHL